MRHRLLKYWPVLWQSFGVRPMDVADLTLTEVISLEFALEEMARKGR